MENPESKNTQPQEVLTERFNCIKCSIKLKDVKLLKTHFWKVHITKNEVFKANDQLSNKIIQSGKDQDVSINKPSVLKSKPKSDTADEELFRKKRVCISAKKKSNITNENLPEENEIKNPEVGIDLKDPETDKLIEKLESLTDEELKSFNLEDIDENQIFERAKSLFSNSSYINKSTEFKQGRIGWAQWRSKKGAIMWPCLIEKYGKDSSNSMKVFIKYYELNNKVGNTFKLHPSKVELFYRSNEHFEHKKSAADQLSLRYEFFVCYTKAIKDYSRFLDEMESNQNNAKLNEFSENKLENASISGLFKKSLKNLDSCLNRFTVKGKIYYLNEIREIVERPTSLEQLEVNKKRAETSKKLIDVLLTQDCEDFLTSIFTETIECARHKKYLNADLVTKRKMKFSSPGPLVEEDQKQLASFITDLSKKSYENKPLNLSNYEYDVLYPEAVIWGLKKLEGLTFKKAEVKYNQGFKRTEEEIIKQRCHEILNNLPKGNQNESNCANSDEEKEETKDKQDENPESEKETEETEKEQEKDEEDEQMDSSSSNAGKVTELNMQKDEEKNGEEEEVKIASESLEETRMDQEENCLETVPNDESVKMENNEQNAD